MYILCRTSDNILLLPTKIDMTPPNVQAETLKQVVKILKSPGCRFVDQTGFIEPFPKLVGPRKTPVFVKSMETAIEISKAFGKDRFVHFPLDPYQQRLTRCGC
jgi:hypothetical protein